MSDEKTTMKIGAKGGISVYGVTKRFPVTLYHWQWEALLNHKDEILKFIEDNKDQLKTKD